LYEYRNIVEFRNNPYSNCVHNANVRGGKEVGFPMYQPSPVPAPISIAVTPSNSDDVKLLCNTKSVSSIAAFQTCKAIPTIMNRERRND
jgi:hypothetical protein